MNIIDKDGSIVKDDTGKYIGKLKKNGKSRYFFIIPNFSVAIYVNDVYQYSTRSGHGGEIRSLENVKPFDNIKFKKSGLFSSGEVIDEYPLISMDIEYAYDFVDVQGSIVEKNCM